MHDNRNTDILGLIGFVILCLSVSGIGGAVTTTSVSTWYPTLVKPWFNPPDWVFAPVWTTLYVLMAVSAWRVWRLRGHSNIQRAMKWFAIQLILNLIWSFLFFGFQRVDWALYEIIILLPAIFVTAHKFWKHDRLAGALFVPYLLWASFATVLNGAIWLLNGF